LSTIWLARDHLDDPRDTKSLLKIYMFGNPVIILPRILDYKLFTGGWVTNAPTDRSPTSDYSTEEEWLEPGEWVDKLLAVGALGPQCSADLPPVFNYPLDTGVETDIGFVGRGKA
jgi:hypothetical protein